MKIMFDQLRQTRMNMLTFLEKNKDRAFDIPTGYNNSIYWNIAHCVVTQQLLCYKLSGNDMIIDDELVDLYRKGTKPTNSIPSVIEIGKVKDLLFTAVDQLQKDYNEGLFTNYSDYETSFGLKLTSIEEAISFNNIHEGIHFGYLLAMVK
ncbi:MAG: DinB family protein [Flavobacteriales bacterium]|nr:DinB family protein [Flavobacteriales bacterium]